MQRRAFLAGLGSVLTGPLAAAAQRPAGKVPHVGFLGRGETPLVTSFRQRLRERGYEEGRNITITARWDEGNDEGRLTVLAADLVRLKVDVIVGCTSVASRAAKAATTTIPWSSSLVLCASLVSLRALRIPLQTLQGSR